MTDSPFVQDPENPTDAELAAAIGRGLADGSLIDSAEWLAANAPRCCTGCTEVPGSVWACSDPGHSRGSHGPAEAVPVQHKIRWFVYTGEIIDGVRERIPRTSAMRGFWPGYDVVCSCGYESKTGGGLRRYVAELADEHKRGLR